MAKKLMPPKGRTPQVGTTADAKEALRQWLEKQTITKEQGEVVAGMIHWFVKQEPVVTRAVLRDIDPNEDVKAAYAKALRRLADELDGEINGEEIAVIGGRLPKAREADAPENSRLR